MEYNEFTTPYNQIQPRGEKPKEQDIIRLIPDSQSDTVCMFNLRNIKNDVGIYGLTLCVTTEHIQPSDSNFVKIASVSIKSGNDIISEYPGSLYAHLTDQVRLSIENNTKILKLFMGNLVDGAFGYNTYPFSRIADKSVYSVTIKYTFDASKTKCPVFVLMATYKINTNVAFKNQPTECYLSTIQYHEFQPTPGLYIVPPVNGGLRRIMIFCDDKCTCNMLEATSKLNIYINSLKIINTPIEFANTVDSLVLHSGVMPVGDILSHTKKVHNFNFNTGAYITDFHDDITNKTLKFTFPTKCPSKKYICIVTTRFYDGEQINDRYQFRNISYVVPVNSTPNPLLR
jgi:hypothetical protein